MTTVLLDTCFVIDHLRGEPGAVRRMRRLVEDGDAPFINDIVVAEAWTGAPTADDPDLTALLRFLGFVQGGPDHAWQAGRWRADARAAGRTLTLADALIGASARSSGAIVLTRNAKDFSLMPVDVEIY